MRDAEAGFGGGDAEEVGVEGEGFEGSEVGIQIRFLGEIADAVAYHKTAAALSPYSPTGLTHIEDVVPFIRHLVSDGWWITGQTILINGGYTTK